MIKSTLDAETLRNRVGYDPLTGIFTWKPKNNDKWFNSRFAGKQAGTLLNTGYWFISIGRESHLAHRLAWLYVYDEWPQYVDHRDRNPLNNAISNLKSVTAAENNVNKGQRQGTSGFKGIHKSGNKWVTEIQYEGKRLRAGPFDTIEEATADYQISISNIEEVFQQMELSLPDKPKQKAGTIVISYEQLLQVIHYDPSTGEFFRKANGTISTTVSGHLETSGYYRIAVGGKRFPAHVLAMYYMTGIMPSGIIDHINGIKSDNRWSNLREVTKSQNALNRRKHDYRGIRETRNKITRWEAAITLEGARHHIGTYDTEEQAKDAWVAFVKERNIDQYIL
jgi:hypothetical protein